MNVSKRKSIRQILDRSHNYRLVEYARKASIFTGRKVTVKEVKSSLTSMKREGQLLFCIVNDTHVQGFTLKKSIAA